MGIKCPKCQFDNPDTQKFCGECGTQLKTVYAETKTLRASVKDSTIGEIISGKYKLLEELGSEHAWQQFYSLLPQKRKAWFK